MVSCNQVVRGKNCGLYNQLELENDNLLGKSFHWKKSHPLVDCKVKTIMRVSTKNIYTNDNQEEEEGKNRSPS